MDPQVVEALRLSFEAFARGDFSPFDALPDDFELVIAPQMPDAGSRRGEDAKRWFEAWFASFDGLTFSATEFREVGDRLLVEFLQSGAPRGSTAAVELRSWAVISFGDATITKIELFVSRGEADAAAAR